MTAQLFQLAFLVTVPFWALMILLPGWRWTERIAGSPLIMLPTLLVYTVLVIPVLPQLWSVVTSPELADFSEFASGANGGAAMWAQIIAWDLFIGRWIYFDGRRRGVHPLVMAPILVLSILLSPFAVLLWFGVRAIRPALPQRTEQQYAGAFGW